MPPEFGRDVDRLCVLELARELAGDRERAPDAAGELADAVTALRLATAGAVAAGPVVFERLDFRPLRIAPLLPIAATQPRGEATRLDSLRARLAARPARAAPLADDDRELGEALDRWELSLFAEEPFRSGAGARGARLRCSARGDGAWAAAVRAAVLLGEKTKDRSDAARGAARGAARPRARDAVRRALVETLLHGNRAELVRALDETLLGLRPRPCVASLRVARAARRFASRHGAGTDTSRLRRLRSFMDEAVTGTRAPGRGSTALAGRALATAAPTRAARRAAGARARGGGMGAARGRRRARSAVETSGGGGRNELSRPEEAFHMALARLLPRP